MNKKHNILLCAALLAAGLMLAGCADDDAYSGSGSPTARPGEAIQFGVNKVATRTVYEEYDSTNNVYPIDWTDYDRIFISSTDAYPGASLGGKHNAVYSVVKPDRQDFPYHGEFYAIDPKTDGEVANSAFGLHWGSGENGEVFDKPYTFYGAYPAQRVKNYSDFTAADDVTDGTISMEYYTNQLCTVDRRFNDRYESTPDMLNAYMVARKTLPTPTRDHILLDFKPAMTTLDIYITAGGYEVATGIIQPVTVTGVSIITPGEVEGDELTFNTSQLQNEGSNEVTLQNFNPGSGSTESVFVGVKNDMVVKVDSGDTSDTVYQEPVRYIDLYEGETLHLMAFLPPFRDVADGTKIKVHALGGLNFVFKLKEGYNYFEAQKRIDVQLPDISPVISSGEYLCDAYLSSLGDNIPLYDLSIPAVNKSVYTIDANGNELEEIADIANRITELLNMGIRGFDLQGTGNDIIFWNIPKAHYSVADDISNAFKNFLADNPGEFIFVWNDEKDHDFDTGLKEDNVPYCEFGETLGSVRGCVVGMKQRTDRAMQSNRYFTRLDNGEFIFPFLNIENADALNLNTSVGFNGWYALMLDEDIPTVELNKIYKKIGEYGESQGSTGIIRLPASVVNRESLLLQSVIDCNFKFH